MCLKLFHCIEWTHCFDLEVDADGLVQDVYTEEAGE